MSNPNHDPTNGQFTFGPGGPGEADSDTRADSSVNAGSDEQGGSQ